MITAIQVFAQPLFQTIESHVVAWRIRRQRAAAAGAAAGAKGEHVPEKPEGGHLPGIDEADKESMAASLPSPFDRSSTRTLPSSPFADAASLAPGSSAPVPAGGRAAAAAEAGIGDGAAGKTLSGKALSGMPAGFMSGTLPHGLGSGAAELGSVGSVAIAPVASGMGSERLMSVRLTATSGGLVYNSGPIPTLLPLEGGWAGAPLACGCFSFLQKQVVLRQQPFCQEPLQSLHCCSPWCTLSLESPPLRFFPCMLWRAHCHTARCPPLPHGRLEAHGAAGASHRRSARHRQRPQEEVGAGL